MVYRNQRGVCRCTSAVPWRSRTTSAPPCSTTATTTPSPTSASAVPRSSRSRTGSPRTPWPTPACSAPATPTPSTPGSTTTRTKGSRACSPTATAATAGGAFSRDRQRKQQLQERLHQGPGDQARQRAAATAQGPPPSRWTLDTIRATFDWLRDYTLSGVWRQLRRWGLRLRSARVQQFSPDPHYADKVLDLEMALWEARRDPDTVVAVFLDQMGFARWPDPAPDWAGATPVADRHGSKQGLWRTMGALNAMTGQVTYVDGYIVGRAKVITCYQRLVDAYPQAERIYAIQDTWSIHKHPDVLAALQQWPQIEPVWLPTYAPWLNPIERLWRWLKQHVLKLHRLAEDWRAVRERVRQFLDQFAHGSQRLLEYVGLLGNGLVARMIHGP